ncbi:MAG: hypothetical protein A2Y56_16410 [Candidatus Aminicenantes bacterium RBG_13_63_10]|nr:MAG: hypothetical protein A2Y56_16410 [Candidatus Aminicenantes bacterium RBG_13_63_10]
MNNAPHRIRLNLASSPLRNRNLFHLLAGVLILLAAAAAVWSGLLYARYHGRNAEARSALTGLALRSESAQAEVSAFQVKSREAARTLRDRVDFANEAIYLKGLSWTRFLAELETALPRTSQVAALAPTPLGKGRVEVRLRVVFSGLDDMLAFVNNLKSRSFANIRLMSEERQAGRIVSEVTLSYEQRR